MASDFHSHARGARARRTYLVDRGFQLRYAFLLAALGAGTMAIFGVLVWMHFHELTRGAPLALTSSGAEETLVWMAVASVLLSAGILGLLGVLLTHRVAGPVYVMNLHMSALAAGRYPRMRPLRKSDELKAFFDHFAEAVERMRGREVEEAALLEQALGVLAPACTSPEARGALEELRALHRKKRQAAERSDAEPALNSAA